MTDCIAGFFSADFACITWNEPDILHHLGPFLIVIPAASRVPKVLLLEVFHLVSKGRKNLQGAHRKMLRIERYLIRSTGIAPARKPFWHVIAICSTAPLQSDQAIR